jgi:hypothetical protein
MTGRTLQPPAVREAPFRSTIWCRIAVTPLYGLWQTASMLWPSGSRTKAP